MAGTLGYHARCGGHMGDEELDVLWPFTVIVLLVLGQLGSTSLHIKIYEYILFIYILLLY
jgi:hypothetical protein